MESSDEDCEGIDFVKQQLREDSKAKFVLGIANTNTRESERMRHLKTFDAAFNEGWQACMENAIEHLLVAMEEAQIVLEEAFDRTKQEELANASHNLDHTITKYFRASKIKISDLQ